MTDTGAGEPRGYRPGSHRTSETVVIGAGIVGMACALYLQRDGHRVTVVERDGPGEGCSSGNAGVFESNSVLPLASPGVLKQVPSMLADPLGPFAIRWPHLPRLLPWLLRFLASARPSAYRANARALATILPHSMPAYEPLLRQAGAEDLVRHTGWLWAYQSQAGYARERWIHDFRSSFDVPVEVWGADEVAARAPALAASTEKGVYFPDAAQCLDPHELVRRLAAAFEDAGGRLLQAQVSAVDSRRDGTVVLNTDQGQMPADAAVIAAGAWSKPFARALGDRVPLDTERGYHFMLPGTHVELPCPVMFAEHKFVATPMQRGLRLAGTVELGGLHRSPDYRRADILYRHASRLLPGLSPERAERWMGRRPTLPDSLPVIGPARLNPRVVYAFGHQHLGLTLAAVTGRIVADMLGGRQPLVDPHPFRAQRFAWT